MSVMIRRCSTTASIVKWDAKIVEGRLNGNAITIQLELGTTKRESRVEHYTLGRIPPVSKGARVILCSHEQLWHNLRSCNENHIISIK